MGLFASVICLAVGFPLTAPTHLTCEYRDDPVGVDAERPRLSWWIDPAAREQKAYRIEAEGLWDSGWVESDQSVNVRYGGAYPGDLARVSWRVKVRTDRGESAWSAPASWVTGKRTWTAKWIASAPHFDAVPDDRYVVKVNTVPWWELKVNGKCVRGQQGRGYMNETPVVVYADLTPYLDGSGHDVVDVTRGATVERVRQVPSVAPPAFRKIFAVTKPVRRAVLAISGLGFYEASLDGVRIGEKRLDPVPTAYDKRAHYSVYELGSLTAGGHVLEVLLGHGWYDVFFSAVWNWDRAPWRDVPKLLVELRLECEDGTVETVATDESWRRIGSPVLFDCIREGEVIGPRPLIDEPVVLAKPPKGRLVAERAPGTVVTRELAPVRTKALGNGEWLFDFGEDVAGWCRMELSGLGRGDVVTVRYDERIGADFTPARDRVITWHYRYSNSTLLPGEGGFQIDRFISDGLPSEVYEPRFTYNGFRYVLVRGLREVPRKIVARVLQTDFRTTGSFDCSSFDFLEVLKMADRAYRGNFVNGYPTDCPHREKNGWTGDANLAAELAQYAYENTAAYEDWLDEVAAAQRPDGKLPGIVPTSGWGYDGYGPVWDTVAAFLPDLLRRYRSDEEVLARLGTVAARVLDVYDSDPVYTAKGVIETGYADHSFYRTYTRRALPNTCYAIGACEIVGRKDRAAAYRAAARREFYRGEGRWENGSQTSQACALAFGLCADEETRRLTGEKLVEAVHRADDHPDFGIVGSKHVFRELSKLGRTDLAFKMATQKTLPSFLYWKEKGGTTFMEELDPDKAPSQNHIMFGDILAWAYQYLAGIRDVEDGFRRFTLAPDCITALDYVTARVETPYGVVSSAWRRQDGRIRYEFTVPPGTHAEVRANGASAVYGPGTYVLEIKGKN